MKDLVPGMMCVVIGCYDCPENIGRTVSLVQFLRARECFLPPDGDTAKRTLDACWLIEAPDLFVVINGVKERKSYSVARSYHLMPIDPDDIVLQIKEKEHEH